MKEPVEVATTRAVPDPYYQPTRLYLYGIKLEKLTGKGFRIGLNIEIDNGYDGAGAAKQPAESESGTQRSGPATRTEFEMAIIYGYSYEGHCYTLPKASIIAVDSRKRIDQATGCGFEGLFHTLDDKNGIKEVRYSMWIHDKLDETVELVLNRGFIEEIILQQNTGGQKAPAAYSAKVQLAHRGGKLVD